MTVIFKPAFQDCILWSHWYLKQHITINAALCVLLSRVVFELKYWSGCAAKPRPIQHPHDRFLPFYFDLLLLSQHVQTKFFILYVVNGLYILNSILLFKLFPLPFPRAGTHEKPGSQTSTTCISPITSCCQTERHKSYAYKLEVAIVIMIIFACLKLI